MSRYDDIINLPHHVSKTRKPMSMENRAAQFAPFAALTGHDDAISETSRLTFSRIELSEDEQFSLTKRLEHAIKLQSSVDITYFQPDTFKEGGEYITVNGIIKKVDEYEGCVILSDKRKIWLADILSLEGDIYNNFDI